MEHGKMSSAKRMYSEHGLEYRRYVEGQLRTEL
jgi:hypothetical protein